MEQANSVNFTIDALLGSGRHPQVVIRDSMVFHGSVSPGGAEKASWHSVDEEDAEASGRFVLPIIRTVLSDAPNQFARHAYYKEDTQTSVFLCEKII